MDVSSSPLIWEGQFDKDCFHYFIFIVKKLCLKLYPAPYVCSQRSLCFNVDLAGMIAGGVCQGLESLKGTFKIYIGIEPPARKCGCTALHRTLQKYKQNVPVTFSGKGVGIRSKTLDNRLPVKRSQPAS